MSKKSQNLKRFLRPKYIISLVIVICLLATGVFFIASARNNEFSSQPNYGEIGGFTSTVLPAPTDGSTPADYDPTTNAYYSFGAMSSLNSFTGSSSGVTSSKVGISVDQYIKANRVVTENEIYKESVSHSSFKGVGARMFISNGNYVIRSATKLKSINQVTWADKANKISEEAFLQRYGFVPNLITAYVFNDESILSSQFLGEENGVYAFKYTLHPTLATGKVALEMRTMAGTSSMPIFERASITFYITEDWYVSKTVTDCVYKVDMLGGVTCHEKVTEVFGNYNQQVEIPDGDLYRSYLDAEVTEPEPEVETPVDYLMNGFGDYIRGGKNLKVNISATGNQSIPLSLNAKADLNINIEDLSSISALVDINNLSYGQVNAKDLFVGYKNQKAYLSVADFKGYGDIDEMSKIIGNILPLFTDGDLSQSLGGIELNSIMDNATLEKVEGVATVTLPINLGDISLVAKLNFDDGETITFKNASVSVNGIDIALEIDQTIQIDKDFTTFNNISTLFNVIDEDFNLKFDVGVEGVTLPVNFNLETLALDVNYNDLKAKLFDGCVYIDYLGLKGKLALNDINKIADKLTPIINAIPEVADAINNTPSIDVDVEQTIYDAINALNTSIDNNVLSVSTTVLGYKAKIELFVNDNAYTLKGVCLNVEGYDISITPRDAMVNIIEVDTLTQYNDVSSLLDIIDNGAIHLNATVSDLSIDLSIDLSTFEIKAKTNLYGKDLFAQFKDNRVYISYLGLNVYFDINDIDYVLDKLSPFIPTSESTGGATGIDLNQILSTIKISVAEDTVISANAFGVDLSIVLNDEQNRYTLKNINAMVNDVEVSVKPIQNPQIEIPDQTYYNIATLLEVIDQNYQVNLNVKAFGLDIYANIDLTTFEIKAKTTLYGKDLFVQFKDNKVYISYLGLNVYFDINDIDYVLDKLSTFIPASDSNSTATQIDVGEIINSIIVDNSNGIKLSTTLFGLDLAVSLNTLDNNLTLNNVSVKSTDIDAVITPCDALTINMPEKTYYDVVTLLDVLDGDQINLKVNALGLDIYANINLSTFTINAKTILYGKELAIKYFEEKVYISYCDINLSVSVNEIDSALQKLAPIVGDSMPTLPSGTPSIPSIIEQINVVEGDKLTINANVLGFDISIDLATDNEQLSLSSVTADVYGQTIIATPTQRFEYDDSQKEYFNILSVLDIIDDNSQIDLQVEVKGIVFDVNVDLTNFNVIAKGKLLGSEIYLKYSGGKVYISYLGLNAYFDVNDIESVTNKLAPVIGENVIPSDLSIDVQSIIDGLTVTNGDKLSLSTNLFGFDLMVAFNTTDNNLTLNSISANGQGITATVLPAIKSQYNMYEGTYYNIATLLDIIDQNGKINLKVNAFDLVIDVNIDLNTFTIMAKTTLYGDTLYVKYSENVIYLSYKGLNVYVNENDIEGIINKILPIFSDQTSLPQIELDAQTLVSSITVTDGDTLDISLTIEGYLITVKLDKLNENLTLNSVLLDGSDISLSVIPSQAVDYSLPALTYNDLSTLLNIIDDQGNVAFVVDISGVKIRATINLYTMSLYARYQALDVYADLKTGDVYANYPGVDMTINFNEIDGVLNTLTPLINKFAGAGAMPDLSLNGFTSISVESIVSSLIVNQDNSLLTINGSLNGIDIAINLNTTNNELTFNKAVINVSGMNVCLTLDSSPLFVDLDLNKEYIDLKNLVDDFGNTVVDIFTSDDLYVTFSASLTSGNTVYNIKDCAIQIDGLNGAPRGNATLTLEIITTASDGTVSTSTHVLRLVYLDPSLVADGAINVYFTYDNTINSNVLEGTFTTTKANRTFEIVQQLYTNMPVIQDLLKPIIVPDQNGKPTLPDLDIDLLSLINAVKYVANEVEADLNTKVLMQTLPDSLLAYLKNDVDTLIVDIPSASIDNMNLSVNLSITTPDEGVITDQTFSYTVGSNASDFSSINELLETFMNTSTHRSFNLSGNVDLNAIGLINIEDKIKITAKLDMVGDDVFAAVTLKRENVSVLLGLVQAWWDYDGTATLYYDPINEMLYIYHEYRTREYKLLQGYVYTTHYDYSKYTVDEFLADPMTPILSMLHLSSTIEDLIINAESKDSEVTPTIENTFIKYAYNGSNTFSFDVDLEPLTVDIQDLHLEIGHDADMYANTLHATCGMVSAIELRLDASIASPYNQYQGIPELVASQRVNPNYPQ